MRIRSAIALAVACVLLACEAAKRVPDGAVLLFDVDFGSPENSVDAAPKVVEPGIEQPVPSALPSQIFLGAPVVVAKACGLDRQPALLTVAAGTKGHAGLEFLLDQRYGHYRIELDLCIGQIAAPPLQANEPQLAIFLDFPDAYALGFFERGRIVLIDPTRGIDAITAPNVIGSYALDKPMHIALDVDLTTQIWTISVDGAQLFQDKVEVFLPRAVRVVIRGNTANAAAIDNLLIWAENDLAIGLEEPPSPPETGPEK